ncbi:hypothetical protein [Streptomyces sp. NPDC005538]|uniref:hypothetical protein n=1 Tax=unclassified Streptomyces TaxID=2593676 RepID=UPI00339F4A77
MVSVIDDDMLLFARGLKDRGRDHRPAPADEGGPHRARQRHRPAVEVVDTLAEQAEDETNDVVAALLAQARQEGEGS